MVENSTHDKQIFVILSSVGPAKVSSFYAAALPQAGYKITFNSLSSGSSGPEAAIEFTGRGYKGGVIGSAGFPKTGPNADGAIKGNFVEIIFTPQ